MPRRKTGAGATWRRRTLAGEIGVFLLWLAGTLLVLQCWRFVSQATTWEFVWDAPRQSADLLARMWPPRWSYLSDLWRPLWDTLNVATLGTALAVLIALPVALAAARNTTPHPAIRPFAILVIAATRSINSLIWALLLVAILGPGVPAGILAIAFRSIGFLAKLLFEAIEEIDRSPVEAVTATGASRAQVLAYGVAPQVLPAFTGVSVFRWDINIREATVIGLVGAGGIGVQLDASVSALQWQQASVIFVVILALVVLSETVSARVRKLTA